MKNRWDLEAPGPYGAVARFLYGSPGSVPRYLALGLTLFALGFFIVTLCLPADVSQEDRDFFPFITWFFLACSVPFWIAYLVAVIRAAVARSRARRAL